MTRKAWLWIRVVLPIVLLIVAFCLPPIAHASCGTHVVRRGETLSGIAWRYGTTASAIARANGLRNPNYIWAGQRLYIPCGGGGGWTGGGGTGGCGGIHVVRRGQNLSMIARWYGTSVWAIARANGLRNPNYIWAGQRLRIPCGGGSHGGGGWVGGCSQTHIVCRGQNLSMIARWYGTSVWAIARANGIHNPNYVWAGQRLCIP
jgi:LysM repeat protein